MATSVEQSVYINLFTLGGRRNVEVLEVTFLGGKYKYSTEWYYV